MYENNFQSWPIFRLGPFSINPCQLWIIAFFKIVWKTSFKWRNLFYTRFTLLSQTNIHITSLEPYIIQPIQTIRITPVAESFSNKLLVNVMGVSLAQENFVLSLIISSLWFNQCWRSGSAGSLAFFRGSGIRENNALRIPDPGSL